MIGTLFSVATPIGNLGDISKRAIDTLNSSDLILAEDTRVTRKLLTRYEIKTRVKSYHQHSGENKKLEILKHLIDGKNIALVSDAGTPGISDPGNELIDYLLDKEPKIKVVPIVGPSAITAALSVCGFNASKFTFLGFFPKRKRSKVFSNIQKEKKLVIFFESPKRLLKTLRELQDYIGEERRIFVGRELTKKFEETFRGSISDVIDEISKSDPRGEVVVAIEKG